MKRSLRRLFRRRRLFNLFAFALLAFAIYLAVFYKEEDPLQSSQSAPGTVAATAMQTH
jgi:hypothetical protein